MEDEQEQEPEHGHEDGDAVVCPHCRKSFVPAPLARPTARHRGTKCPHCRLFVPQDRVGELARDGS